MWVQRFGFIWGERLPEGLVSVFPSRSTDGTWQILDTFGLLRTKENWMVAAASEDLWYSKQKPKQLGSSSLGGGKRRVERASNVLAFW